MNKLLLILWCLSSQLVWSDKSCKNVNSACPQKRFLIGGNWKSNGNLAQVDGVVQFLNNGGKFPLSVEVVVATPSIHLQRVNQTLRNDFRLSAQDVGVNSGYGAYTGEISADMLVDSGIQWTLTGHSERRVGFGIPGETNELVGRKTAVAVRAGMSVIACIGEQLTDRENGRTVEVLHTQLEAIASQLSEAEWVKVVIAYEPVWAIGTGKVATPEQAEETHREIREWIAANVSAEVAAAVRIIYGGSVKGSNCRTLIACPNIDGFLVGGASLLPEFVDIIKSAVYCDDANQEL